MGAYVVRGRVNNLALEYAAILAGSGAVPPVYVLLGMIINPGADTAPVAPVAPTGPDGPVGPDGPDGPVGPDAPVGPEGPDAPVAPVAPAEPVW